VIDTNVLISALIFPESKVAKTIEIVFNSGKVLVSPHFAKEFSSVIQRKKFDTYTSLKNRNQFLHDFMERSFWINPVEKIQACRDVKDNMILELAVDGQADIIITGDKDLLELHPFREIFILSPNEFLNQIINTSPNK
jgi:uncharacterized protein